MQNRAGRIITFNDYNSRSADILQDLRWDTLEQRRSKQLAIIVFKSLNNLYPESLKKMFKPTSRVHSYNVEMPGKMFLYQGPVLKLLSGPLGTGEQSCGGLENVLKDEINLNSFKSACLCFEPGLS